MKIIDHELFNKGFMVVAHDIIQMYFIYQLPLFTNI